VITVPAEEMARLLTALRDEHQGSVEGLLAAARKGAVVRTTRRRLPEPVPLRSAGEALEAVRLRLITREEARRLLGLRARPASRSTRSPVAAVVPEVVGGVVRGGVA
jgi:hypothetical protein